MATALETITLIDRAAFARVSLAPSRGGMATRFDVGSRPVFFLDEATLVDTTKNVRGGNPVLFPSPGPLAGDRFTFGPATITGSMKQHGLARQRPWAVAAQDDRSATLVLKADDATRAEFPWDFVVTFRYALEGTRLRIDQRYENRSATPMPFAAGFHPYFYVPEADKSRVSIPTDARTAFDNVTKRVVALAGPIDLAHGEVDLHLVDHGRSEATLTLADGHRIVVCGSAEYTRWVIWTLPGKDFVCLEPWTAPANALNSGESLLIVPPGAHRDLWTEIAQLTA